MLEAEPKNEATMEQVLELCVLTGRLLLNSGAETYRVEETVRRLAYASGADVAEGFATPTGLFISVGWGGTVRTRVARISDGSTVDLHKVARLNDVSRAYAQREFSIEEATRRVKEIASLQGDYNLGWRYLAAAIASGGFAFLFHATLLDGVVAAMGGLIAYAVYDACGRMLAPFVSVFFASLCSAIFIGVIAKLTPSVHMAASVIGGLFPLVPGMAVTNAIRDLMAGDLLAGLARGSDAFLTAVALAAALVLVLSVGHLAV